MSLQSRLAGLISAIGQDIKTLEGDVGTIWSELGNNPSGDFPSIAERLDSAIPEDTDTVDLAWVSDGDTNGLFYHLGSNAKTQAYSNPVGVSVVGTMSSLLAAGAEITKATDRTAGTHPAQTANNMDSWMRWDFGTRRIQPDRYTLQGRTDAGSNYTRSWVLEGSDDNTNWTILDTRTNDTSMGDSAKSKWASYPVNATKGYRYLRIRQIGTESTGNNYLLIGEAEFYGQLTVPKTEWVATPWKNLSSLGTDPVRLHSAYTHYDETTWGPAQWRIFGDEVQLRGSIKRVDGASPGPGSTPIIVDSAVRPPRSPVWPATNSSSSLTYWYINPTTGYLTMSSSVNLNSSWITLDHIRWSFAV